MDVVSELRRWGAETCVVAAAMEVEGQIWLPLWQGDSRRWVWRKEYLSLCVCFVMMLWSSMRWDGIFGAAEALNLSLFSWGYRGIIGCCSVREVSDDLLAGSLFQLLDSRCEVLIHMYDTGARHESVHTA